MPPAAGMSAVLQILEVGNWLAVSMHVTLDLPIYTCTANVRVYPSVSSSTLCVHL